MAKGKYESKETTKEVIKQKVFIAVTFSECKEGVKQVAHMEVDYNPGIPMINEHKKDYGVSGLQASAVKLPKMVESELGARGYIVTHPGMDNPKL